MPKWAVIHNDAGVAWVEGHPPGVSNYPATNKAGVDVAVLSAFITLLPVTDMFGELDRIAKAAFALGCAHERRLQRLRRKSKKI